MQRLELRVHIAAPGRIRDDARWVNVARAIAAFKPARRVNLTDAIIDTSREGIRCDGIANESLCSTQAAPAASSNCFSSLDGCEASSNQAIFASTVEKSSSTRKRTLNPGESTSPGHAKRAKRPSFAKAKEDPNVTSKIRIADCLKSCKEAKETPRPRTAPETTVLVPFTESPRMRRTPSNMPGVLSVDESHNFSDPLSNSHIDETSFIDKSPERSTTLEIEPFISPSTSLRNSNFQEQRYLGNQELLLQERSLQRMSSCKEYLLWGSSQTSFRESCVEIGTRMVEYAVGNAETTPQNGDRNQPWRSGSAASTETASVSTQYLNNSSPAARKSIAVPTPVIDLTTEVNETVPEVSRRDVLGPVSSPVRGLDDFDCMSRGKSADEAHLNAIRALPTRIKCRASNTITSRLFKTFIPAYLRDLADRFDLINHFHPVSAPRSIKNVERGYWKLLLEIAETGSAAQARRSPLTSSQWSDTRFMLRQEGKIAEFASTPEGDAALRKLIYPNVEPGIPTPWTADEFTEFWEYLRKVIERGRAGYDVCATIKSCDASRDGGLRLEVRLWGWAETLSHLWLVLYGLSSGLTARMPLQWFGPGKGALITMSGQPKRGGAIGRWIEQKRGANGHWGLEEI